MLGHLMTIVIDEPSLTNICNCWS